MLDTIWKNTDIIFKDSDILWKDRLISALISVANLMFGCNF